MYKRFTIWTVSFLFSFSFFGCVSTSFKDFKPKSKEEAAIKHVLVTFGNAANKGDVQGVSPLLHENFSGPVGKERTVLHQERIS